MKAIRINKKVMVTGGSDGKQNRDEVLWPLFLVTDPQAHFEFRNRDQSSRAILNSART